MATNIISDLAGTLLTSFKVGANAVLSAVGLTGNRTYTLPDKSGTVAMTSDIINLGKNCIINGNFLINQRAVTGTVTLAAGVYGHDRFKAGAAGCTYTFAKANGITTLTITAGSLQQVIEGDNLPLGNNTCVMSWTGTSQGKIGAGAYSASGVTATVAGGTNLTVEFNTGPLSLVQFEKGATATAFEQRPIGQEMFLCMRYFEIVYFVNRFNSAAGGVISNSTLFYAPKRAVPTISIQFLMTNNASSVTVYDIHNTTSRIEVVASAAGDVYVFTNMIVSAEL